MRRTRRRIGLLGGSFNPAHAGHVHLSMEALKTLGLDEVWWLVSPANPLKSASDLAAYTQRLASARHMAQACGRIRVSSIEAEHGWRYTIDTVRGLVRRYPHTQFVWLMGADNLMHFHRWRRWVALARAVPIAVFDRAPFTFAALPSRFALRFARRRLAESLARQLVHRQAPAWVFVHMRRHPLSATFLRNSLGAQAFFGHNQAHHL